MARLWRDCKQRQSSIKVRLKFARQLLGFKRGVEFDLPSYVLGGVAASACIVVGNPLGSVWTSASIMLD